MSANNEPRAMDHPDLVSEWQRTHNDFMNAELSQSGNQIEFIDDTAFARISTRDVDAVRRKVRCQA